MYRDDSLREPLEPVLPGARWEAWGESGNPKTRKAAVPDGVVAYLKSFRGDLASFKEVTLTVSPVRFDFLHAFLHPRFSRLSKWLKGLGF